MKRSHTALWAAAGSALTLAITAVAASAAGSPVADRQAAMKAVGQGMKDASSVVGGTWDAAKAKASMDAVAANAKKAKGLFPAGSDKDPKTEADPKIWANKADFDKRLAELNTLATAAGKAKTQEEFRPAFQKVGATCKSCHDSYRMKKKA